MNARAGLLGAVMLLMGPVAGAQEPVPVTDRLMDMLPAEIGSQVVELVRDLETVGLPGREVATRALQGVARGRSGDEVLGAARELADALRAGGAALGSGAAPAEVSAAAAAIQAGAAPGVVAELARGAPSGRSLVVPLAVLGDLVARDLPVEEARALVEAQLARGGEDAELLGAAAEAHDLLAQGVGPGDVARSMLAGIPAPAIPALGGLTLPVGIPVAIPVNGGAPGGRPGPPTGLPITPPGGRD